jgi:hypothetical protein
MTLTPEQVNIVTRFVIQNRVTLPTLKDDVVDHLCCEVEAFMKNGKSFEEALRQSVYELAPHGLHYIQQQTFFLLEGKIIINMRKLTFILGTLAAMSMSFGWLLKVLSFPGVGNPFFAIGAAAFLLLFLPMLAITYFRRNKKPTAQKLKMMFGVLSAILIGIALLARIMHLPGADEVLWAGGIVFTFGFLPSLFYTFYQNSTSASDIGSK